ncbi:citrate-binding protein isoform X2 [Ziziphus jujuba]|uniref:Citrate-binding protein isoform X2 n=1 Tax=Ziziphus jujuba TaxID=326968 RepID=A0ABM4AEJ4_ZIZJJ|nr:citrate-binding protein isoform X2 [Ziziphus jujuba]
MTTLNLVLAVVFLYFSLARLQTCAWRHRRVDLIKGFLSLPLNQSNFVIQRPYDVPENERYSFINGVHRLWVYSTDKPHALTSHTNPRTEIRIAAITNGYSKRTEMAME